MPSSPSLQACLNTVGPSPSMWSLNQMPWPTPARTVASVALRTSSGLRRRSSPFNSIRSKAYRKHAGVVSAVTDALKARHSALVAGDGLPVDDAGARAQPSQGFNDQREAVCQVIARPAIEPHLGAVLPCDHPKSVMLDFVQPQLARWRLRGFRGKARRDEADGQ